MILSEEQLLFLQSCIIRKLYRQTNSLRKIIAHRGLYIRVLPFLPETNNVALNRSVDEVRDRIAVRQAKWMGTFDYKMAIGNLTESFAALNLDGACTLT